MKGACGTQRRIASRARVSPCRQGTGIVPLRMDGLRGLKRMTMPLGGSNLSAERGAAQRASPIRGFAPTRPRPHPVTLARALPPQPSCASCEMPEPFQRTQCGRNSSGAGQLARPGVPLK